MKLGHIILVCGVLSTSCSRAPLPLNIRELSTREAIAHSSIILVGVIQSIAVSGEQRLAEDKYIVQTWRIGVRPLSVLKGSVKGKDIDFEANYYAPGVCQNGNFEWLRRGDRRILFLSAVGDRVRSVSDLYRTSIPYPHTTITTVANGQRQSIGEEIATLLLTELPSDSPREFAEMIPSATYHAIHAAGLSVVASLLARLSKSTSIEVRTEACLTAYEQLLGDGSCVNELESAVAAPLVFQRLRKAREHRLYLLNLVRKARQDKQHCPFELVATGTEPDQLEFLKFLSQHSDPDFQACGVESLRALSMPPPGDAVK